MNTLFWNEPKDWTFKRIEKETAGVPSCLFPYKVYRNDGTYVYVHRGIQNGRRYYYVEILNLDGQPINTFYFEDIR